MTRPIRLLIADNNVEFLMSVKALLDQQPDINVVGAVRDGQGALTACQETLPDLLLIDLRLPVLDSVRAIQAILAENEHIRILGLSAIPNDRYAVEAIKAGACGYVEKTAGLDHAELLLAIRQIAAGEVVVNSGLALRILEEFS